MDEQKVHPNGKRAPTCGSRAETEETSIRVDEVIIRSRPPANAESYRRTWDPAVYGFAVAPRILEPTPETPPGTLGLRADVGGRRLDYFIDPRRDFLCVRYIEWCRIGGGWVAGHETILSDLTPLADGCWSATRTRIDRAECSECCSPRREHIWQFEAREPDDARRRPQTARPAR